MAAKKPKKFSDVVVVLFLIIEGLLSKSLKKFNWERKEGKKN